MPGLAAPVDLAQSFKDLQSNQPAVWHRAESDIQRAWSNSGSPALDLLLERGRQALAAKDYPAAIGHLTALIDHAPDFAEAYNVRAQAYYAAGEIGPAINDIGMALKLNPKHFGAMDELGSLLDQIGKPKDALAAFRMSIAIHPHQPPVLRAIKRLKAELAGQEL
ncbi:MAG: tetratricopeptide repeat protein [Paracoccaceae bacterium]|nr:tetratricopeptide repeat protein [Paracoccaceae bacterium]